MQTQTEMQREVDEAVRTMRAGGIILYPTDTVWGLGCDATSAAAVERIYRLKRSGNKKSMLVLCASADMIVRYVNKAPGIAFEVMELATSPLTAILPGAAGLAENLIPDEGTLGVRIPDHEFCRRMLRALGRPVVSTSANISGEATPAGLQEVAQEIIDAKRAELGLDQPFLTQYGAWLRGLLTGNMGVSYVSGKDVFGTFVSKLPATLLLTALSIGATVVISIPLGIWAAVKHDKFTDYVLRFFSFIGNSLPNFFVALLLMQLFSIKWKLLPVISGGTTLQSAILPTLTLAIAMSAKYMRQVRAAVLEELSKDYVLGAAARGVRGRVILWKSVLKSAMLTILTLLALSIGSLLGGTAIIESIFMWDGVGKLAVDAITMRDYPLIQAYVVWMAIIYVMVNLVTDILYHVLDPRIRLGVQAG